MASAAQVIAVPGKVVTASPSLSGDSATPFELFSIPGERLVHGNSFPLGIRVKLDAEFKDVNEAARTIEELAKKGTFDRFLDNRKPLLSLTYLIQVC
jgi:hypothetical protein